MSLYTACRLLHVAYLFFGSRLYMVCSEAEIIKNMWGSLVVCSWENTFLISRNIKQD